MNNIPDKALSRIFLAPIFILSTPRCGSTLLFNLLKESPEFLTVGGESHAIFGSFPHLEAENVKYDSGCLGAQHADEQTSRMFRELMALQLRDRDGVELNLRDTKKKLKVLEKTPRNALNVPFIKSVFPSAKFIFLHRDPMENISSIIEAWGVGATSGRFVTFKDLPGWQRKDWCLLLPPGWRDYNSASIAEIAAFQWRAANDIMLDEMSYLPRDRWVSVSYERLLRDPLRQVQRLCAFAGVRCDSRMKKLLKGELPLSKTIVTPPEKGKWKKRQDVIKPLLPALETTCNRIKSLDR